MFDSHVHSFFSGDSEMDTKQACNAAEDSGLSGIAFTDHLDIDFPDFDEKFMIDFEEYSHYMDNLKSYYNNRLKILKGVETGIQPHVIDETNNIISKYSFDYVIGSIHIIDGNNPYYKGFYDNKTKNEIYSRYLELILYMINNYNNYDIVGHFDFIARKSNYNDNTLRYNEHSDLFDEIFKVLIQNGKGFEINTAYYRNTPLLPEKTFDISLLKRYKELGGEIICIGSDAHHVEYIGYKFNQIVNILFNFGFKYLTYFEDRKPYFYKIK